MTTETNTRTCAYVARRDQPETWGGERSAAWKFDEGTWSCPHEVASDVERSDRCVFHRPVAETPAGVDEAAALVEAVETAVDAPPDSEKRRRSQFVGATFRELDFRGRTLPTDEDLSLVLAYATVGGTVDLTGASVGVRVAAHHATFGGPVTVDAAFAGEVLFHCATFEDRVALDGTDVGGLLGFARATFREGISLDGVAVDGDAVFWESRVEGEFRAKGLAVDGETNCSDLELVGSMDVEATFRGELNLSTATLTSVDDYDFFRVDAACHGPVTMGGAAVDGHLAFDGSVFHEFAYMAGSDYRAVDFGEVVCHDDVALNGSTFGGNVWFRGTEFEGRLDLREATFEADCTFQDAVVSGGLRAADATFRKGLATAYRDDDGVHRSTFEGDVDLARADLTGLDLAHAPLSGAVLRNADLTDADLTGADLRGADLEGARLSRATLFDANLAGAGFYGGVFGEARIDAGTRFWPDDGRPALVYESAGTGKAGRTDGGESTVARAADGGDDLRRAAGAYRAVEQLARGNAFPALQSRAFVRRQDVHRRRQAAEGEWGRWLRSTAARLVLLYGESPWRVIGVSVATVVLCGLVYPFGLFERTAPDGPPLPAVDSVADWLSVLPESLYFSTLTFTTLGFGDFRPVGWGRLLATFETGLGVTLLALLVFVLGRRAAR